MPSKYTQYGGAAGADLALREMVAERLARQMQEREVQRQLQADNRAERQLRLSEETTRQNSQSLREQREMLADQRRQNTAHTLAGDLAIGDVLDPQQAATLRSGNLGSNVEHQPTTLPSRETAGFVTTSGSGKPSGGFLRTAQHQGQAERDVYRGTSAQRRTQDQQRQLQQWINRLPANSPERLSLEYQLMTGQNPPAALIPREPTARYSAHPMFDETGSQTGIGAFNNITGEMRPANGGGFLRMPGGGSSRQLPARVENYLMQLRHKHPRHEDAIAELTSVLGNAPNETFSRVAAANALRQLYAEPTGNDALSGLDIGSILNSGEGAAVTPRSDAASMGQPRPPAGGSMTRAELRAVAQQLGINEQQAEQQARARGLSVR